MAIGVQALQWRHHLAASARALHLPLAGKLLVGQLEPAPLASRASTARYLVLGTGEAAP
jgi:hypothetical protein